MPLDLSPLEDALNSLDRALARAKSAPGDEEVRDACIQRFEYCFELSWKMLKRLLEEEIGVQQEVEALSRKDLFRVGGERGLVANVDAWFEYLKMRNLTSHTYDQGKARLVYASLDAFSVNARDLYTRLEARNLGSGA